MARSKHAASAIQPAQGKRKTFDENDSAEEDFPVAGPSRTPDGDEWEDYSDGDEGDEDDAPEAVSVGAALKGLQNRDKEIASTQQSKREAAAARSKAIADAKAAARFAEKAQKTANKPNPAGTKRKAKAIDVGETEVEDADAKRLRKRMEAAMAAGDDESDDEDVGGSGEGGTDGDEDDEGASFHTDSEDEEEGEEGSSHASEDEDDDAESDSSETLKDGPISDKERSMRAQMQAMMEAAEARSGVSVSTKAGKTAGKGAEVKGPKSALKKGGKRPAEAVEEEEDNFDLAPLTGFGRPLSAKVLRAAVQEEEVKKSREAEMARIAREKAREAKQGKRKRRKLDKKESVKQLSDGRHLQLLEPELPISGSGLPPIMPARSSRPAGAQSRSNFFKTAMKTSGLRPGKGMVDGRKRAIA